MAKLPEIKKDLDFLTGRLSSQVRTVAVSLLIATWGLLIGKVDSVTPIATHFRKDLIAVGGLAILAMTFDFLQYFFGYLYTDKLRADIEHRGKEEVEFDKKDLRQRLRHVCFHAKQYVLLAGLLWFAAIVIGFLL